MLKTMELDHTHRHAAASVCCGNLCCHHLDLHYTHYYDHVYILTYDFTTLNFNRANISFSVKLGD